MKKIPLISEVIQQLQAKIEKQEKVVKLLKESNDWYSNCDDVGVFARKTKKKVEEIENG